MEGQNYGELAGRYQMEIAHKDKRISALEAALVEIRDHEHCDNQRCPSLFPQTDDYLEDSRWRDAHAEGHRCCAEIARRALEKK